MYADFKITMWERITIPNELKDKFVKKLKEGEITSVNEAYDIFGSEINNNYELLLDTGENIFPEQNGGAPTIELHSDENAVIDEIIWDNGRTDN